MKGRPVGAVFHGKLVEGKVRFALMDTNPGSAPSGQPPQGGDFEVPPPQGQAPQFNPIKIGPVSESSPSPQSVQPPEPQAPPTPPQPPVPLPQTPPPLSSQPLPPPPQAPTQSQSPLAIKPSWQVQAMQNVWSQQQNSSQAPTTTVTPYNPQQGDTYLQQPYQFAGQQTPQAQSLQAPIGPPPPPPPQQPAYSPNYDTPAKSGKGWIIAIVLLLILGAAGAAAIFLLARGGNSPQAGQAFQNAIANTFKTQTYTETATLEKGNEKTTRNRQADFRKLDEPRLYVDNIAAPGEKDTTAVTVIGDDYFVKKHFSDETLAKAAPEQAALMKGANDQWVKVIQDGNPSTDAVTTALGVIPALQKMRVVVPSPLPVGYFRDDEQKQLNDFVTQNNIYTPNEPISEKLENTDTWRYQVSLNADKVRELNAKAAQMHGAKQPESVTDQLKDIPGQIDVWVRQSDSRIMQYSYRQGDTNYSYRFDKLDQSLDVAAPKLPGSPPSGQSASDVDIKTAADTVFNSLASYLSQGNALPSDQITLDEFVSQKLEAKLREQFTIQYKEGVPEKGYVFYRSGSVCKSDNTGIEGTGGAVSFAVLTKLSDSLYCVDNTD